MKSTKNKRIKSGLGGIVSIALVYLVFLFQDAIPQVGGIDIAQAIMAGLFGWAAYSILFAFGIDLSGSKNKST
tara:strand:- start:1303 stop:1521 length:219 start_codon:yes stop_codon:yes gene_type:complete